jgi:Domain of unknown function (DUF4386)
MRILDRSAALTGAAYILLTFAAGPGSQTAHPTGVEDLAYLHSVAGSTYARLGVTLELLGFAALIVFIGYLCTRVRDAGWLATAALAGGVVAVAIKLASAAPVLAAYVLRDEISPGTARVLVDMNAAAFVTTWLPIGIFVACAGAACLATRTVGRILGWGGVVVGSAAVVLTAATGVQVLAANPLPFLFCLLWILLVSVRLGVQRKPRVAPSAPADAVQATA